MVVIPLTGCAQATARQIADKVESAVFLPVPLFCDFSGPDQEWIGRILTQIATQPNVGAAIFVTLTCAAANNHKIPERTRKAGREVKLINVHLTGGTTACVAAGVQAAEAMSKKLQQQRRVEVPLSSIVLATKCGSSDATSL